ncbi:MAG TPA: hypothetical protein VGR69_05730 [Candidatus Rubrimentiphilum sp.]|nr:hypothetical protein [Candidatus Rubrimentiphilum sp.]
MRKALPLWVMAVVPATLVGHALAYFLDGRSMADGRHAWFAPVFECSIAALILLCASLLSRSIFRYRFDSGFKSGASIFSVWLQLAIVQTTVFAAIETAEGAKITFFALAVQIVVALCAAYLLSLFARLVARCLASAQEAFGCLLRLLAQRSTFIGREPTARAVILFACAGSHRFQRPPPIF